MSTVYPYVMYHLDHRALITMEHKIRRDQATAEEQAIVRDYIDLMSNRPRVDPSIRESFGSVYKTLQESIDDVKRDVEAMNVQKLVRKAACAKRLLEAGVYIKVADVVAATALEAIELTFSVTHRWMLAPSNKVVPTEQAWRSTEPYDVIKRFDEFFLKLPLGILDMQESKYAQTLV